jgi:hypothetical protein
MLTDIQCRKAAAKAKGYALTDAGGLHLYVTERGSKSWRFKYRFAGQYKRLVIGPYPEITLQKARAERDRLRAQIREGQDPGIVRKQEQAAARVEAASTFEALARQWHALQRSRWSDIHFRQVLESLELHLFPRLGKMPINAITPPMMLEAIRAVEGSSIDIAKRVQRRASKIFTYAIAIGVGKVNPAAAIKDALQPMMRGRYPSIVNLARLRRFLADAEAQDALPQTRLANRFLALTQARPSMVRLMPWSEVFDLDGDNPEWRIPAERMKLLKDRKYRFEFDFIVPLSPQAVDVLRAARQHLGGKALVFPAARDLTKPLSDATLAKYCRVEGYGRDHVPHGWRSSFSTIMNEIATINDRPEDRAIIDLMLAHLPSDVESAYNRYAYLPRRRQLAQEWADLLLKDAHPIAALLRELPPRGIVRMRGQSHERADDRRGPGRPRRKVAADVSAG